MALIGASPAYARSDKVFNRHRFDNYTAWLDREDRKKAKVEGRPLGYGYAEPREIAPEPEEKPFIVQEAAFTSGKLLNRKYIQYQSCYKTGNERSDGHHYPNYMNIQEANHYEDRRRRSAHEDPSRWIPLPGDKELADAVPQHMVTSFCNAHAGKSRKPVPRHMMKVVEVEHPRPAPDTVRELNVDLSCADLREAGGTGVGLRSRASGAVPAEVSALAATTAFPGTVGSSARLQLGEARDKQGSDKWTWCLGGRKQFVMPDMTPISSREGKMQTSQSLPRMLTGQSLLSGAMGEEACPFHGEPGRKFGTQKWDGRMRGGKLARDGWAGTFPQKETALRG